MSPTIHHDHETEGEAMLREYECSDALTTPMQLIYVWASCLDKAIVEISRGRFFRSRTQALRHRHSVDNFLYTFTVMREFIP